MCKVTRPRSSSEQPGARPFWQRARGVFPFSNTADPDQASDRWPGGAGKNQVAFMVRALLGLTERQTRMQLMHWLSD